MGFAASEDSDTPVTFGKRVAVIGGGNTAMDSVSAQHAAGEQNVQRLFTAVRKKEMPARLEEVKHAKEEGVEFLTLHNPIGEYIADERGRVKASRFSENGVPRRARWLPSSQSDSYLGATKPLTLTGDSQRRRLP